MYCATIPVDAHRFRQGNACALAALDRIDAEQREEASPAPGSALGGGHSGSTQGFKVAFGHVDGAQSRFTAFGHDGTQQFMAKAKSK